MVDKQSTRADLIAVLEDDLAAAEKSLELAVALTVNGASPKVLLESAVKLIVWFSFDVTNARLCQ